MNVARPSDGLLPASSTIALAELLAKRPDGVLIEHLLRDLAATIPISWSRARNTILKLAAYELCLLTSGGKVRIVGELRQDWRSRIASHVVSDLTSLLTSAGAWSCVSRDQSDGTLLIDAMILPPIKDGLAMWLTDFAIAKRVAVQTRFWTIASDYEVSFLAGARDANLRVTRRAKSIERLAADLARQAEAGEAAELWVVQFERERLRDHPLRDQIRRVSPDDVYAGYDIVSFASAASISHDRYIEVKSHGPRKVFHWSRNEIATAQEFGEEYVLYLVDRDQCMQPQYRPHMITGPSPEMFALPDSGWHVEATSFEHTAVLF